MSESVSTYSTAEVNSTSAADWTGNTQATADTSATADMGAAADMVSPQSLQDFVFGLLTNVDARAAYETDPQGALDKAGLNDVTPADVQDIHPLVADYVPAQGITSSLSGDSLAVSVGTTIDGLGLSPTLDRVGGLGVDGVSGDLGGSAYGATGLVGDVSGDLGGAAYGATGLVGDVSGDLGGAAYGATGLVGDVSGDL
ncbi:IniB N-terminal domain-containing protein, partial [Micromonospora sp. 4G55]|uniref:IniB N-terminal domain-containing protein n=1 Tax=Micromonospora sp. 4G55 TaxID=2806102 RepID=UPI001A4B5145